MGVTSELTVTYQKAHEITLKARLENNIYKNLIVEFTNNNSPSTLRLHNWHTVVVYQTYGLLYFLDAFGGGGVRDRLLLRPMGIPTDCFGPGSRSRDPLRVLERLL